MAREDVNVKVSANVAEALALWKAMEQGPKGMAGALGELGNKGKQSTQGMVAGFDQLIGKWASIHTAISLGTKLLTEFMEANRRVRDESFSATERFERSFNALQIQAGIPLRSDASKQARAQIWQIAEARAVGANEVSEVIGQLVSGGMPLSEAMSGGADEFLKMLNATGTARPDIDKSELAKATMLWMSSTKQEISTANLRKNNVAIANMFKDTNLQMPDLARFSEEAGQIYDTTKIDPTSMMAMFATMLSTAGSAKASTAFRSFAVSLGSAGAGRSKIAGLEMLGIKPEQVDFQGEDEKAVLGLLSDRVRAVDDATRNVALQKIFGAEGGLAASVLLDPKFLPTLDKLNIAARNEDTYSSLTFIGERNDLANVRRQEIIRERSLQGGGLRQRERELAVENDLRSQGYSEMRIQSTLNRRRQMQDAGFGDIFENDNLPGHIMAGKNEWGFGAQSLPSQQSLQIQIKDPNGNAIPFDVEATNQNKK